MADNDNELSKVLKEQAKIQKEVAKDLAETNREIDATTREFSSSFQKVVKGLQEVNPELAKTVADIRKTSKDTLAGALQKRKTEQVIRNIELLQKKQTIEAFKEVGGDLDLLKDTFKKYGDKDFDFDTFANIQAEVKRTTDRFFEVQRQLGEQADLEKLLIEKQKDNNKATSDFIKEQAAFLKLDPSSSLEDIQKKLDENFAFYKEFLAVGRITEKDLADAEKDKTKNRAIYDEMVSIQEENAKIEKDLSDLRKKGLEEQLAQAETDQQENLRLQKEFNERVKKNLKELNEDSNPIGDMAEGLKDLTGGFVDLESIFDDVVKYTNAFGKLFGQKDLFGTIVSAGQKFLVANKSLGASTKFLGGAIGSFAAGATALGTQIAGLGKRFMGLAKGLARAMIMFVPATLAFIGSLLVTATSMLVSTLPFLAIGVLLAAVAYGVYKAMADLEEKYGTFSALWSGIMDLWGGISTMFSTALSGFIEYFSGVGNFFYGLFTGDFDLMWQGLVSMWDGFWEVVWSPFAGLFDFFSELFDFDIIGYFKNKIKGSWVGRMFGQDFYDPEEFERQSSVANGSLMDGTAGILTRDDGMDTIDTTMIARASDEQIQAILDTADLAPDDRRTLEGVLADRAAIRVADDTELALQQMQTSRAQAAADEAGTRIAPYIVTNAQSTNSSTSNVYPAAPQTRNYDRYGATVPSTQFVY